MTRHTTPRTRRIRLVLALAVAATIGVSPTATAEAGELDRPTATHGDMGAGAVARTAASDRDVNRSLRVLARVLARAMDDPGVREQIHSEVAKKFDGDFNALFSTLSDDPGFSEPVEAEYSRIFGVARGEAERGVAGLVRDIPRLQVSVPVGFGRWSPHAGAPSVAVMPSGVEDTTLREVTAFDTSGDARRLDAQDAPTEPVVVVGVSERTRNDGSLRHDLVAGASRPGVDRSDARAGNLVELVAATVRNDREPWAAGAAEISFRAQSRGCRGVGHTDYDVPGLEHDVERNNWPGGIDLGLSTCPVIFSWWEDDGSSFDFELSYGRIGLGVRMDNDDDLIGGHQHRAFEFRGNSRKWYRGLGDIHYRTR